MTTMNKNNRGITTVEILIIIAICGLLLGMLIPALSKAKQRSLELKNRAVAVESYPAQSDVVVREQGRYDGYPYIIFEDKATKTRVFYYHGAMTFLPKKEGL